MTIREFEKKYDIDLDEKEDMTLLEFLEKRGWVELVKLAKE